MREINRRHFLRTTGKLTLAGATALSFESVLLGLIFEPNRLASAAASQTEFDVYNAINPSAKDIVAYTFKDCLSQGFIPSIYYKTSKPMVAVAKGTVTAVRKVEDVSSCLKRLGSSPNDAAGYLITVVHGKNFKSVYLHLRLPEVKFGQKIERGQIIGYPDEKWHMPRLCFNVEYGAVGDPNNFGISHSYMTYWDGVIDLEIGNEEQDQRQEKQNQILNRIAGIIEGPEKYTLLRKKHKGINQLYKWAMIEKFRNIEYLQQKNPDMFPSLTKEQFLEMKKEFYANQPIILTLPFKKG